MVLAVPISRQTVAKLKAHASAAGIDVKTFAAMQLERAASGRVKKKPKRDSLAALNKKLFSDPKSLLAWGEENTRRLTGKPRI
ncbi:MAG TPA: hypothetical protein VGN88_08805 [Phycisphaerae bacterium]|jgi:hypothetical protein